jgi:putative nucleotidyltransferase with HDIG domain
LDGTVPSDADLRIAKSLAVRLAEFEGLRPFPIVVQKLISYVSTADYKLDRVREMIESDPALAARIMRVANSAAYRAYELCTSISRAIIRIGATGVMELAMGVSAMNLFVDIKGTGQRVRDHAVGTAAVARELAFRMDMKRQSSQLFLSGLLHDIGKLLLLQSGDLAYATMLAQDTSPNMSYLKERAHWGFDHALLGAHILNAWNFPPPIPQIIAAHHQSKTDLNRSPEIARAVDILRVADAIEWILAKNGRENHPQVKRLINSPDGVRAGLHEGFLFDIWDDLVLLRHEALSIFR